ncbi:MAG: chalcone isomerase family protein [Burkholderiales bacterium]|jgi:hypothetical protein
MTERKSSRPSGKAVAASVITAAALATEPLREALASSPAAAPVAVTGQLQPARLVGEGELRFLGFRVYTARLWISTAGRDPAQLLQQPMALELRYLRGLLGETIVEGSEKEIARLGFGTAAQRTRWSAQMKQLFPDVREGDRLTGVFDPARGVRFFHNDQPIGSIDDTDFGRAFFSIWLDERTQAPSLRTSVMQRLPTLARNP